jgi:hypothetical protein
MVNIPAEMLPGTPAMEALGDGVDILGYLAAHSASAIVARAQPAAPASISVPKRPSSVPKRPS